MNDLIISISAHVQTCPWEIMLGIILNTAYLLIAIGLRSSSRKDSGGSVSLGTMSDKCKNLFLFSVTKKRRKQGT